MKVFIDTNILLDIFHLSGPDLEELRKLKKMVEKGKVELLVSTQVVDEFWRNREKVIADAMKLFRESKATAKVPNIIRIYPEAKQLKSFVDQANDMVKTLIVKATADIENDALKADKVIRELISAVTVGQITDEMFVRAQRRVAVGNPPGKPGSIGDALNWEWLLEQEIEFWDDELVVISGDNDYESELLKGTPKEFLVREWSSKNVGCSLILEKSLTDFLLKRFPDIQLAEEVDKLEAIERLEQSSNFATTHSVIGILNNYDDFKEGEIVRIATAFLTNNQVSWILGDTDVLTFARKMIALAKSEATKAAIEPLQQKIDEMHKAEVDLAAWLAS
jgi:predicted nucleic acid-binding protein